MNAFTAVSAATTRRGYWVDWETNRQNKRRSRRKSRHVLNAKTKNRAEIKGDSPISAVYD